MSGGGVPIKVGNTFITTASAAMVQVRGGGMHGEEEEEGRQSTTR